jgi:Reverse transcriptase (RNA-dependent DNA polymerase)
MPLLPREISLTSKWMHGLTSGVIEPSKSPWGFPALISYRNGKPRMCIDYQNLNKVVVPDEFPLPRQDAILQALTGSHRLSTLDALAGFTQLQMADNSKDKTAFQTYRGLYHFRCLPFGYRNGPAVFQRVMQGVLAPFLWIFTLVYIDEIVIYSKTFEEHLIHIDKVFSAIEKSGVTLSPAKCHLAYQSVTYAIGAEGITIGIINSQGKG